jgi:hypothetical protein
MVFDLTAEADWPPVATETLWVESIDEGIYRIDNVPFLARGIAVGDLVEGDLTSSEMLRFVRKLSSGGHFTVQLITLDDETRDRLRNDVFRIGCGFEGSPWPSLTGIDVPDENRLDQLHKLLSDLSVTNRVSYIDACI